jgi:acetyl-CoA carboxylase biotin carboxylase subunit
MFQKVLIANRGEIAVRIIRACRDLGISPVAVYSEADRTSLHVRLADEAYLLEPVPFTESYLVVARIIEAARRSEAEAIHPGYGFLSENPALADACADAGVVLIGPSAASIRLMGSKTDARAAVLSCGVPVIPGTQEPMTSPRQAAEVARRLGYPVLLKAAGGGGGKGMRLVEEERDLAGAFDAASSEALRAFNNSAVYLEKYLIRPRHIEIQVLTDRHGNAISLGERECSIQRRHQKVIEECPSPAVDDTLRRRMGEVALRVARAASYENAGTVEFLLDESGEFYFLEMNTRLQVEHPVTELVYGVDLVQEQFRIAAGEKLSLRQEDVRPRGWALECRIYAEDPEHDFFPSPGRIRRLVEPQGPGVRVDSGVYEGSEVSIYYDPLIAKLATYGVNRDQAINRMKRAIAEYRIQGVRTNLRFFAELLSDPDFVAGRLSTDFIEGFFARRTPRAEISGAPLDAAAVAASLAFRDKVSVPLPAGPRETKSRWRMAVGPYRINLQHNWRRWQ